MAKICGRGQCIDADLGGGLRWVCPPSLADIYASTMDLSLPSHEYHKQKSLHSIYTKKLFIPPDGNSTRNIASSRVYDPIKNMQLVERLPGFQNIVRTKLYAMWLALANAQITPHEIHIPIYQQP